jgi:transposase
MRFAGIDIAAEEHVVAVVGESGAVEVKATPFGEDAAGYQSLLELLGAPEDCLVAMEATGHYWQNVFAVLAANGFAVALLNPLRTRRFAQADLQRTKTDAIDAVSIARFAQVKCPAVTRIPDEVTQELRELVRFRDRLLQDMGDRVRQLHRLVDLGFPEFTRHVKTLDSDLATTILHAYPTAQAFPDSPRPLAKLRYGRNEQKVGGELARALVEAARISVGQHHGSAYRIQVKYLCEDIDVLRRHLRELSDDVEHTLKKHEVGSLLTTIDGIGPQTAARIVAEVRDLEHFASAGALAAYVGVVPGIKQSGKHKSTRAGIAPIGNARLRQALWMPTLTAVRKNPWLRAHYQRFRAAGKLPKVALIAAMRKLLVAVFSVVKNRKPFVPILAEVAP